MKQKDDATLSLFGDELPASDLQEVDVSRKKTPNIQTEEVIPVVPPSDIKVEPTLIEVNSIANRFDTHQTSHQFPLGRCHYISAKS